MAATAAARGVRFTDIGSRPGSPSSCPRLRLFALGARSPTDKRGPWVYVTSLRAAGPPALARTYRQRWRVEQVIEELLNGHDLDDLVSYRLHLDGLGTFAAARRTVTLAPLRPRPGPARLRLPWTGRVVVLAA